MDVTKSKRKNANSSLLASFSFARLLAFCQYFWAHNSKIWRLTWCFIYFNFLLLDLLFPNSIGVTILKFLGLCLCLFFIYQYAPNDNLLAIAFSLTLLADTILLIDNSSIYGIVVFCLTHFFHLARLAHTRSTFLPKFFFVAVLIFLFSLTQNLPPIYALGFIYALSLGSNLMLSFQHYQAHSQNFSAQSLFYGFFLFTLCDLCVMLAYFSGPALLLAPFFHQPANFCAWLFYYPAQVLISTSATLTQNFAKIPNQPSN